MRPHTHQPLDRFRIQKDIFSLQKNSERPLARLFIEMAGNGEADWAALPDDLIQKIGDILLSTEDLDCYAFLRTLCGGWRRATAEPHFMPSNWIVLDHSMSQDDLFSDAAVKLMNVRTGRIVEKKIHRLIRRCFSSAYILSFVDLVFVRTENELPLSFSLIKSPTPFL